MTGVPICSPVSSAAVLVSSPIISADGRISGNKSRKASSPAILRTSTEYSPWQISKGARDASEGSVTIFPVSLNFIQSLAKRKYSACSRVSGSLRRSHSMMAAGAPAKIAEPVILNPSRLNPLSSQVVMISPARPSVQRIDFLSGRKWRSNKRQPSPCPQTPMPAISEADILFACRHFRMVPFTACQTCSISCSAQFWRDVSTGTRVRLRPTSFPS